MVRCQAIFYNVESGFRDVELTGQCGHDAGVAVVAVADIGKVNAKVLCRLKFLRRTRKVRASTFLRVPGKHRVTSSSGLCLTTLSVKSSMPLFQVLPVVRM